jgi:hypothetical protein
MFSEKSLFLPKIAQNTLNTNASSIKQHFATEFTNSDNDCSRQICFICLILINVGNSFQVPEQNAALSVDVGTKEGSFSFAVYVIKWRRLFNGSQTDN